MLRLKRSTRLMYSGIRAWGPPLLLCTVLVPLASSLRPSSPPPTLAASMSRRDILSAAAALGTGLIVAPRPAQAGTDKVGGASLGEFWTGLLAGGLSRTAKLMVLHPIDTVKTRVQLAKVSGRRGGLFSDLYDGILPPLVAGTPGSALFFATKDFVQSSAKESSWDLDNRLVTMAAVFCANIPYWTLQTPAEALKTRMQARDKGVSPDTVQTSVVLPSVGETLTLQEKAVDLYAGYISNLVYAFPVDVIKFLIYDELKRNAKERSGGLPLDPLTSAIFGSVSSSTAQALTTPLDVVRTRIMLRGKSVDPEGRTSLELLRDDIEEDGVGVLFAGTPQRILRGLVGGAVQFSVYETSKNLFGEDFAKKMKK